jgi:hypothetical protein
VVVVDIVSVVDCYSVLLSHELGESISIFPGLGVF